MLFRSISEPALMLRILELLTEVAWCARTPAEKGAVVDQLARTRLILSQHDYDPEELANLTDAAHAVDQALANDSPLGSSRRGLD